MWLLNTLTEKSCANERNMLFIKMYVTGKELIWFLLERTGKFIVTIQIYLIT